MKDLSKSISKVLGQLVPVIIILATVTPFIMFESLFFPFITGKAFYFRILVEIAAFLYIVWAVVDKSVRPRWSPLAVSSLVFLSALSLATIFAIDPLKSFWSNFERMEGLVLFLHLIAFFFIAGSVMKLKEGWWKWFFNASLIISVFVGIDAFVDFYSQANVSGYRISGNLGNSSYLGIYSLMHIFISLFFVVKTVGAKTINALTRDGSWVSIGFYALVGIFNLVVMFNTGTRGSFVGLVGGVFVSAILIAIFERKNQMFRNIGIGLIALSVLFVLFLGLGKNTQFVKQSDMLSRFGELVTFDAKTVLETQGKARSLLWGIAWEGTKDRPVFGWGLDNFHYVFSSHYDPHMYGQEQWFDRSHNVFMDWLTQAGFVGLISYLSLFGGAVYVIWKKREDETEGTLSNAERAVITGGFVAYLGHNMFVFDNLSSYVLFFSVLAFAHQYWIQPKLKKFVNDKERYADVSDVQVYSIGLVAVAVFGFVVYSTNIKPISANVELIHSLQPARIDPKTKQPVATTAKEKFESLQKSIAYHAMTNSEQIEQLADRGAEALSVASITNEQKEEIHKYVTQQYLAQFERTPTDPRPYFFYAIYLQKIGLLKEASEVAQRLTTISPDKQSFLNFYGIMLLQQGKAAEGLVPLEKSYKLDESNVDAFYIYLAALVQNGKYAEAEELGSKDLAKYVSNLYVTEAYVAANQVPRIVDILTKQIALNPNSIELRSNLVNVYIKSKNTQKAIQALEEIKKVAPQFAENVDQAIKQVKTEAGIK